MLKKFIPALLFIQLASARDTLRGAECIPYGSSLRSDNNCFSLELQFDGNLVLYRDCDARVLWRSNTQLSGVNRLCLQNYGNLVLYGRYGNPEWYRESKGRATWFKLQDDGIAVFVCKDQNGNDEIIWSTGTQGTSCYD